MIHPFTSVRKHLFLLILSLGIFLFSFSQSIIKGKVVDATSGEPLVGATVKLDNSKVFTMVKLDGTFILNKVTAGNHTLKVKYQDYDKKTEKEITVSANETKVIDFILEPKVEELSSVTVSAGSASEDKGARRLEKIADPIINVLSAKTIQLLPDITVANALQRVSGVTIEKSGSGEARYPIIRGMEKRYINTLVNGIKIPSPDNRNRFIPLDLFPSELLERLEVSKSLTPSMEGDAIGGTINLVMKDAPAKMLLQVNASTGYNTSFVNEHYNQFDKSSMSKLSPAEINGSNYVATPKDFSTAPLNYTRKTNPINSTFGLTVGDRFGKKEQFGFIVSGSYQNLYRGTTSNFFLPNAQPDGANNNPGFQDLELRKYSIQSQRTGLNGKLDYQVNKNNKISFITTYIRLDDYQTRIYDDTIALNGIVNNFQRSQWQYQSIYNNTLQGVHHLTSSLKVDWNLVYSIANNHMPDQSEISHQLPKGTPDLLTGMKVIWSHNSDKDYAGYLNLTDQIKLAGKPLELKLGTLIRSKTRDNFYNSYNLNQVLNEVYTNPSNAVFIFSPASAGTPSLNGNNYTFKENISAGYIQGKLQVTDKLEALGGVRVEHTYQQYETQLGPETSYKSGTIKYTDVLPSLQFKYALTKNQTLRFAYYKALARPGFAELIPDGPDGEFFKEIGNPKGLNHTLADNFDLRYELYTGNADQVLLGVFYKNIKDPIEISAVKTGVTSLSLVPSNVDKASNYGFEAVYTKYFGAFGVSANYTFTQSRITNDSMLYTYTPATGGITTKYVSETRPLQGQSNHIGNLSLIYKNPKIGLDIQAALVYTGERIAFISPYAGLHYWQAPTTQLDLSFEKNIIKKLSCYGKINNLTNAPFELALHQSYNAYAFKADGSPKGRPLALQTDPANKIIIQKDYYKTSYLLGVRYKL